MIRLYSKWRLATPLGNKETFGLIYGKVGCYCIKIVISFSFSLMADNIYVMNVARDEMTRPTAPPSPHWDQADYINA